MKKTKKENKMQSNEKLRKVKVLICVPCWPARGLSAHLRLSLASSFGDCGEKNNILAITTKTAKQTANSTKRIQTPIKNENK